MKIKKLQIYKGGELQTEASFDGDSNYLIFSATNSHGKTTLIRFLVYAFGFSIPSTSGIRMPFYRTILSLDMNGDNTILEREGKTISVLGKDGSPVSVFDLSNSDTQKGFLASLFGVSPDIVPYLLNCFYIDQSDGWTNLYNGKISGNNKFNLQAFLRTMAGVDTAQEDAEEKAVLKDLSKYQLMSDMYDYAKQNAIEKGEDASKLPADYLAEKANIQVQKAQLDEQIDSINRVVKKNLLFADWIAQSHLQVTFDHGQTYHILSSENIHGFNGNQNLLLSKKALLEIDRRRLMDRDADIDAKLASLNVLPIGSQDLPKIAINPEQLAAINQEQVRSTIQSLRKRLATIRREKETKKTPEFVVVESKFLKNLTDISEKLGVFDDYLKDEKNFPFVTDRGKYPGAVKSLIIVSYRLACRALLEDKGIVLPFIIDSPGANEVDLRNIELMEKVIIASAKAGVFISSIFDTNLPQLKKKTIVNRLFDSKSY
jgi:hypothetical protein